MRTAIAVITYNRPQYFQHCIKRVVACEGIGEADVWVCMDGGRGATIHGNLDILSELDSNVQVITNFKNSGCGLHHVEVRNRFLSELGYDRLIVIEDDMLLGPTFYRLIQRLADWATTEYDNIGAVSLWYANQLQTPDAKRPYLRKVVSTNAGWTAYMISRRMWENMWPLVNEYSQKWLGGGYGFEIEQRTAWLHEKVIHPLTFSSEFSSPFPETQGWDQISKMFAPDAPRPPIGQDAMTAAIMYHLGYCKIETLVNRCVNIGVFGVNSGLTRWNRSILADVKLHDFAEDYGIREFEPYRAGLQS